MMAIHGRVKLQSENRAGNNADTVLFFGLGYSALAVLPLLRARGMAVMATTREPDNLAAYESFGIEPILFDGRLNTAMTESLALATHIISSVPPSRAGDPVIDMLSGQDPTRLTPQLRWAAYLSATSVYGDRAGQWAFEDELLYPTTSRGRARVEAELSWLETGWPVHIFRLAGIYGPALAGPLGAVSRNPFTKLSAGTQKAIIKPGHIVNRIHVEDIASALLASINAPDPCTVYNIADGNPAAPQEVLHFAADAAGLPRAPETDLSNPSLSKMVRSFYTETKRIDITRAQDRLGWAPQFGTYKEGLTDIIRRDKVDKNN